MNNNLVALKSGVWYIISNFIIKGIGFITMPIFARLLSKTEFGAYNNYISWLSIFSVFVTLNLESTLISARYDYENKFDEYILSMLGLSTLSAFLFGVVLNTFSSRVLEFTGVEQMYLNAMLLYLVFTPFINMFQLRERYYFEYKKTILSGLVLAIGSSILSVFLVWFMSNRLAGRVWGMVLPTVVLGIYYFFFFLIKGKKIVVGYWKYAIPICLPYIPHLLSMTILNSTDRVMITKYCGSEQTALYSLAYSCGTVIVLLINSLNGAFAPWLGDRLASNDFSSIRKLSRWYISGFLLLSFGIMLISPEILLILGGKSYLEAIYILAPIAMGSVLQFLYTMFVNIEQFKKKTLGMAIGSAVAAIVNLSLNAIFIPKYGYFAAAYTTLTGYMCLLLIHMFLVKKIGFSEAYDYKFIVIICILGIASMLFIVYLYSHNTIRYVTILIYIIVLLLGIIKYKDKIISKFKRRPI